MSPANAAVTAGDQEGDSQDAPEVKRAEKPMLVWVQDPVGDGDYATSDGIEVFTFDYNDYEVGDCIEMTDFVEERIAGGAAKCDWLTGELGFDAAINYKTNSVCSR